MIASLLLGSILYCFWNFPQKAEGFAYNPDCTRSSDCHIALSRMEIYDHKFD